MKKLSTLLTATAALTTSLPALAHSEHTSTLSGIVHFMTEPDHLLISAAVAAAVIYAVRKIAKKRA